VSRTTVGASEPDPDDRWLDAAAAAELLGVPVRDLMAMIDRGDLPAYRIDGRIRLRRSDVARARDRRPGSNGGGP
jgi:excisionase family DNA binding protein